MSSLGPCRIRSTFKGGCYFLDDALPSCVHPPPSSCVLHIFREGTQHSQHPSQLQILHGTITHDRSMCPIHDRRRQVTLVSHIHGMSVVFMAGGRVTQLHCSPKCAHSGVVAWICRWIAWTAGLWKLQVTADRRHTKTAGHGTFRLPCRFLTLIRDSHSAGSTSFPPFGTCRVVSNSFS